MKVTIFALVCAVAGIFLGVAVARARLGEATALVLPQSGEEQPNASNIRVPRVSVDQETYDFGYMERHSSQSHEFLFTNAGNAPLELTVGETTCKCTIGKVPKSLVEPGETVPVTLSWTAETEEPQFRQRAEIHTNDPLRRHVSLSVVGRVGEASSFYPKTFNFGNVPQGASQTAQVKIVSTRDEPFEIETAEFVAPASAEHFRVEIEELPPGEYPSADVRAGFRVSVTALPTLPYGTLGGALRIKATGAGVPVMEVPLAGSVVSDFSIYGQGYNTKRELLDMGQVVGKEGAERRMYFLLRGERGKAMELEVSETYPEYLTAEFGERTAVNDNSQAPLIVRVRPGAPPAVHLGGRDGNPGRIVVKTNHPSVPEVTINVQFTVE
jgi:hypothetical protein